MQGARSHAMHNHTHKNGLSSRRMSITWYFPMARWDWSVVEKYISKAPVKFVVLAGDTYTDVARRTRMERKARSGSIVILTGEGHSGCSGSCDGWRGGRKTEMTKPEPGPLAQMSSEHTALLKSFHERKWLRNNYMDSNGGEKKSALAVEQPQCGVPSLNEKYFSPPVLPLISRKEYMNGFV